MSCSALQNSTIKEWTCTRCGGIVADFQLHTFVHDEEQDLTAFAGRWPRYGNAPFVVFRGTDSHNLGNWIANLEVFKEPYYLLPIPGAVHCAVVGQCKLAA